MRIQEIAEELVNLTVKEVNELAQILNNGMEPVKYDKELKNYYSSPKKYGIKLLGNKNNYRIN